jgi:hypothetical protein
MISSKNYSRDQNGPLVRAKTHIVRIRIRYLRLLVKIKEFELLAQMRRVYKVKRSQCSNHSQKRMICKLKITIHLSLCLKGFPTTG